MSIIIKLLGLPLEANSVDVRLYLGLTIPDGGVHIIGGDEGLVFIEFANDEDARQAMSRSVGTIKNSNITLLFSSRNEMQSMIDSVHQKHQHYLQQQQQLQQQSQQPQPFQHSMLLPQLAQQPWYNVTQQQQPAALLPWMPQQTQTPQTQSSLLHSNQNVNPIDSQQLTHQMQQRQQPLYNNQSTIINDNSNSRVRGMSSMRGGDDKLFLDKKCVLAATNIPYRATSTDIIDFLAEFNISEDHIRRRYNQKGQPTGDAKIAFPTQEAATRALKLFNKKLLCGRPIFLAPV